MDRVTAIGQIKYLCAMFDKYDGEMEGNKYKTYLDYFTILDIAEYKKALDKMIKCEKFFPRIATIEQYYQAEKKVVRQKSTGVQFRVDCRWCQGNGLIQVIKGDYDYYYRCTQCKAGAEKNECIKGIDSVYDVPNYNLNTKKEGSMSVPDIQKEIFKTLKGSNFKMPTRRENNEKI